jgi:hypothetical protein
MQNTIHSLADLFLVNRFQIPQYQRAYSWEEEPHLDAFLEDLRQQAAALKKSPNKRYFFGTFLLHEEDAGSGKKVVNVVDGQQRITTSVVFIATALSLHKNGVITLSSETAALLAHSFVCDGVTGVRKFRTIAEDEPFFQSAILGLAGGSPPEDSPSARRLQAAADYFTREVKADEWETILPALTTANVMVYAVHSAEDATQIFELQNDRGKRLTSLEALKSFLMHCIYLHSPEQADDRLGAIQTQFSKIFRTIERLAELNRTPEEDQLLANHCVAYLRWSEKEYNNPKQLVKATIKAKSGAEVVAWIETFVSDLVESYRTIEALFLKRDSLPEFSELLVLNRMGSFWPLILKTWRYDTSESKAAFLKTCRLLEVFTFRGYAVANLRADTNLSPLQIAARDFDGDFGMLHNHLTGLCRGHDLDNRFHAGLDNPYFYQSEGKDAHYLLWRYENHLRTQPGCSHPLLSWRDFVEPRTYASKFSVEHIAAQSNDIADSEVKWVETEEPKPFAEVAMNRLGNLVIDTIGANSSKGAKDFTDKLKSLSERSIFLSQGELINFVKDRNLPVWDVEAVHARHKQLVSFARKEWDPAKWHII